MSQERDESNPPNAEAFFDEFLRRRDEEPLDFDDFCQAHPNAASSLRALHSLHQGGDLSEPGRTTQEEKFSSHLVDKLGDR